MSELENYMLDEKKILDAKYQYITYYKQNGKEIVKSKDEIPIDFLKAMYEVENLNWKLDNHIGFENHKTDDVVQFIRKGKNNWYVDVPIKINSLWNGYFWGSYSDNKTISNMLRLYFEEVDWFDMLRWKMGRVKN